MELNIDNNIDDEWNNFIANKYENDASDDENNIIHENFNPNSNDLTSNMENFKNCEVPEPTDIYISTKGLARELKIPIWTVSQVNRAGAKDDVIEGDKAAGSYNKMMIADFAISLSRKRLDKVNGTGRIHIMKNRYGRDGMSHKAEINTSTGHIIIERKEIDEDEITTDNQQGSNKSTSGTNFSNDERQYLQEKFFELSK